MLQIPRRPHAAASVRRPAVWHEMPTLFRALRIGQIRLHGSNRGDRAHPTKSMTAESNWESATSGCLWPRPF